MSQASQPFAPFPYTAADRSPSIHADTRGTLLADALAAAVPLNIATLVERGGPTSFDWSITLEFADVLAYQGDVLQFGGEKGEAAQLFNGLAEAIAVMSFYPGGITIFGQHYEAHLRAASDPPYAPAIPTGQG